MIGKTISHYKILEKLGEGGMGVVYKAQDTKLKRTVALKFLPQELLCDSESKARFVHEAQAASALNHPNITTIHEIDEFEGECFIAMEYIEGKSIKELVEEKGLSIEEILRIAIQIAEGLSKAHQKDIVHRDIKSDNIMLTPDGLAKIMDFGLAKLKGVTGLTKTGSTLGTLQYMSPEQAYGEEVDSRSDIFSFGVVLYEIIAGQLPFKGEHKAAIIYSILSETPEPLARYKASVPDELQRVVDKALAKNREERFQHVADMLADLKSIRRKLETIPTFHEPEKPKRLKKRSAYIYASAAILIIILALIKYSYVNLQKEAKQYVVAPIRKGPYYPQKKGGDCEFDRHGPQVTLHAKIFTAESNTQLKAEVKMTAKETKSNWSHAEGAWPVHLYTAEPGWYINRIISMPATVKASYTDTDYDWDLVVTDLCNFEVLGDTQGDDICNTTSDDTHIYVNFKEIRIELRKK